MGSRLRSRENRNRIVYTSMSMSIKGSTVTTHPSDDVWAQRWQIQAMEGLPPTAACSWEGLSFLGWETVGLTTWSPWTKNPPYRSTALAIEVATKASTWTERRPLTERPRRCMCLGTGRSA